jgi:NADP-dependent alcohol dehydrogenase
MIGHEITALKGLDHARTLAVLLPAMLKVRSQDKRPKLLQYAQRVWGITAGDEDERIDAATDKTRAFFESMQVPTRLSAYGITGDCIPLVVEQLKAHDMVKLGERKDVTPEMAEQILRFCL